MAVDRKRLCRIMWHMHNVMTALNDEDILAEWYTYGIPDGTESPEKVEELYSLESDEALQEVFDDIDKLFARLIAHVVRDGYSKWIS